MTNPSWAAMPLNLADRIKNSKRIPRWLRFPLLLVVGIASILCYCWLAVNDHPVLAVPFLVLMVAAIIWTSRP